MRYSRDLRRLAFSIKEGTKQAVVALVANFRAAVPEFLGVALIGNIVQHSCDFTILDLIVQGAAKLEVVTLLVDRV